MSYKQHFIALAESKNFQIEEARGLDKKNNIDLFLKGKTHTVSVDIKKRNGKKQNNWVYIEYTNSKGGTGWIYGLSDFIAFETQKSFILVPRKALLNYLSKHSLVRFDLPYVDKPWLSKYRLFRRPNTLEVITQIKISDLMNIKGHQIWPKE